MTYQAFARRLLPALAALAGAAPTPALAHPHVWIDNVTSFVFDGVRLKAVRLTWAFDEFFGTAIIRRFDENRNGRFEPEELAKLEPGAFANLKEYKYFTHILLDGKELAEVRVEDFQASVRNGQLIYDFTVPLPAPVDPSKVEVIVTVYDESYFVEVALEPNDPVRFHAMPPGRCAFAIREGSNNLTSFGIAPYQLVSLSCQAQ
jgi:ABC-type uncharacterized transport system substrate-binding protein